MVKRWYDAFLDGYKPAILLDKQHSYFDKVQNYPHITPLDAPESFIFFQTPEQKEEFGERMQGVKRDFGSHDFHYYTGLALGFPERSVKEYARWRVIEKEQGRYPEQERKESLGVIWAGFFFASYKDIFTEEIRWIWEVYNHPKSIDSILHLHTEVGEFQVTYGDHDKLYEISEYIRLVPTATYK